MNAPDDRVPLLVLGYGNTLRGDDGVGPRVAESVAAAAWPGVRTISCHQLSPELADPVSRAESVVFVDASVEPEEPQPVRVRTLEPEDSCRLLGHAADPGTLLALARDVFGHAPRAWLLTLHAVRFEFVEELTPAAAAAVDRAVTVIDGLRPK